MIRRRCLCWSALLLVLVSSAVLSCQTKVDMSGLNQREMPRKRVLFVCVENSNRSQMAEAFARIHGAGKVDAYSGGSRPSGKINPKAIEAMRELGYDLALHHSKSVDALPDVDFDVAVTMGCGDACPFIRAKQREDWEIPDPKNLPPDQFRQVRNTIEEKVKQLLASL